MKIVKIHYNWRVVSDGVETIDIYDTYLVGDKNVTEILEHPAVGHGDAWFYDVHFENGAMERIFNPNQVFYEADDNSNTAQAI